MAQIFERFWAFLLYQLEIMCFVCLLDTSFHLFSVSNAFPKVFKKEIPLISKIVASNVSKDKARSTKETLITSLNLS